jgi:predicted O-methyltransferase YrrM
MFQNVPLSDGGMLRLRIKETGAQTAVELGASAGILGPWPCALSFKAIKSAVIRSIERR